MPPHRAYRESFIPASTTAEAISRVFALTGRAPDRTRGEKRALVALRDALQLDVDTVRTNDFLGRALADALDVEWLPDRYTRRHTLTLDGLNALLEGAAVARRAGSLTRLAEAAPDTLRGPAWAEFQPAPSKIEAVTRIAALTNAPREWLGPGAKEHKSAFLNLADALFPAGPINKSSKTKLGASLARALDVTWTDACASTRETITLVGLNTILAGAERHLGILGTNVSDALRAPEDEGDALAAALLAGLPTTWDGRKSIQWLADHELRGANDNEWQGYYGEERAKVVLGAAFTPKLQTPRVKYGNAVFDYSLNRVWDIKVHTEVQIVAGRSVRGKGETQLNHASAVRSCVAEQGLGYLIVSGEALMDNTGDFIAWHREFKASRRRKGSAPSNSGRSNIRKASFSPMFVEAFWLQNTEALDAAIAAGSLRIWRPGAQAPRSAGGRGASRADKFMMRMRQARHGMLVARYDWQLTRDR